MKVDFNNVGTKRTVMQRWLKDICFNEPWEKRGACPLKSFRIQKSDEQRLKNLA